MRAQAAMEAAELLGAREFQLQSLRAVPQVAAYIAAVDAFIDAVDAEPNPLMRDDPYYLAYDYDDGELTCFWCSEKPHEADCAWLAERTRRLAAI